MREGQRSQRFVGQVHGVRQAVAGIWRRGNRPFFAGIGDHDQVCGQVAAVDRRNVGRMQRLQALCLVPVVEVAPVARQLAHCSERRFHALDRLGGAGPAEVARSDGRQQVEPDIGWRGPVRHDGSGCLLEVVGWQHVVRRRDEGFEEAPGAACGEAQRKRVGLRQDEPAPNGRRTAAPQGKGWRRQP
ncbi:hypothetical protein D9M70_535090 [compost metagenome]